VQQAQELQPPKERTQAVCRGALDVDAYPDGPEQDGLGLGALVRGDQRPGRQLLEGDEDMRAPEIREQRALDRLDRGAAGSRDLGHDGAAVEALGGRQRRASRARSHEHVAAYGLGVRVPADVELAAILDQLHQPGSQAVLARRGFHGGQCAHELLSRAPDVGLGNRHQGVADRPGPLAAVGVERRDAELRAPPAGVHEISGKHCAPCVDRW
jgi:hypothetical protein